MDKIKQILKSYYDFQEPGHDFNHVLRVEKLALEIAKSVECDTLLVNYLALFHDINDHKFESKISMISLLEKCEINKEYQKKILDIVPYLSFSKYPLLSDDFPIEGKIVSDADRIDALGAIGVARAFSYGGSKNRSFDETIKHFEEKLLKLDQYLYLDASKDIAKDRMVFLKQFYNQFKKENNS